MVKDAKPGDVLYFIRDDQEFPSLWSDSLHYVVGTTYIFWTGFCVDQSHVYMNEKFGNRALSNTIRNRAICLRADATRLDEYHKRLFSG